MLPGHPLLWCVREPPQVCSRRPAKLPYVARRPCGRPRRPGSGASARVDGRGTPLAIPPPALSPRPLGAPTRSATSRATSPSGTTKSTEIRLNGIITSVPPSHTFSPSVIASKLPARAASAGEARPARALTCATRARIAPTGTPPARSLTARRSAMRSWKEYPRREPVPPAGVVGGTKLSRAHASRRLYLSPAIPAASGALNEVATLTTLSGFDLESSGQRRRAPTFFDPNKGRSEQVAGLAGAIDGVPLSSLRTALNLPAKPPQKAFRRDSQIGSLVRIRCILEGQATVGLRTRRAQIPAREH
jgi:hypothetical protein